MTPPHPYAAEIKVWAEDPKSWRWEFSQAQEWRPSHPNTPPPPHDVGSPCRLVHRGWVTEPGQWEWRVSGSGGTWSRWLRKEPFWYHAKSKYQFRRIRSPKTIRVQIGEKVYDLPEPMREEPNHGDNYWTLDTFSNEFTPPTYMWRGDFFDKRAYRRCIWRTKEEARQWAAAFTLNPEES